MEIRSFQSPYLWHMIWFIYLIQINLTLKCVCHKKGLHIEFRSKESKSKSYLLMWIKLEILRTIAWNRDNDVWVMKLTRKELLPPWPLLEHFPFSAPVTPPLPVFLLSVKFTGSVCFTWVSSRLYPSLLFLLFYSKGSPNQVSEWAVSIPPDNC